MSPPRTGQAPLDASGSTGRQHSGDKSTPLVFLVREGFPGTSAQLDSVRIAFALLTTTRIGLNRFHPESRRGGIISSSLLWVT